MIIVEILKDEDDAACIELAVFCGEQSYVSHDLIKILAADILFKVVEIIFSLEGICELYDEWVGDTI